MGLSMNKCFLTYYSRSSKPFYIVSIDQTLTLLNFTYFPTNTGYVICHIHRYIQYKHVEKNFFKWFVHIYVLKSPYIAWMGIKSCAKILRILVTVVYFTDRNWISKTLYFITVSLLSNYRYYSVTDAVIYRFIY